MYGDYCEGQIIMYGDNYMQRRYEYFFLDPSSRLYLGDKKKRELGNQNCDYSQKQITDAIIQSGLFSTCYLPVEIGQEISEFVSSNTEDLEQKKIGCCCIL